MIEYRSNRGRRSGSRNGDRNRTNYEKTDHAGATQQSVSFSQTDEETYLRFAQQDGVGRTEFVRAAIESYENQFEWETTRKDMERRIEEQFAAFVQRYGTAAEHERDILSEKHSKGAALTMALFKMHTHTVQVRKLLRILDYVPTFISSDDLYDVIKGEYRGEWMHLYQVLQARIDAGDVIVFRTADEVIRQFQQSDDLIWDVIEDITPHYNNAVTNIALRVLSSVHEAIARAKAAQS